MGSNGEFPFLSVSEKKELLKAAKVIIRAMCLFEHMYLMANARKKQNQSY